MKRVGILLEFNYEDLEVRSVYSNGEPYTLHTYYVRMAAVWEKSPNRLTVFTGSIYVRRGIGLVLVLQYVRCAL